MQIALAPMEGLVDDMMREMLTGVGGIDWCVSEFVRVSELRLPTRHYRRLCPEMDHGWQTPSGVPLRLQLLGSDPVCLADNAAFAASKGAPVVDLNFGCPAKTVNKSKGGAILLREPELLHRIACEVRRTLPAEVPLTAKMRLGYDSPEPALDCARALADGGASMIVVHARTKVEGYRPPAHWEWVARIQDVVAVPVYANGEIWNVEDYRRCREVSGAEHVMLGRGLVSCPDLALQIRAEASGQPVEPLPWSAIFQLLQRFWRRTRHRYNPRYTGGRLKQWVSMLRRNYPEAVVLFEQLRREADWLVMDRLMGLPELAAEVEAAQLGRTA